MLFPDQPRVIYEKNPLVEVICQLRFPPILSIDTETPASFQGRIRKEYPHYRKIPAFPPNVPAEVTKIVESAAPGHIRGSHEFASLDKTWSVTLARDFVALKTTHYERWEEFCEHLSSPFAALNDVYQPAFFSRIGLRYVDLIQPSKLGLNEKGSWHGLIKPHMAGEFLDHQIAGHIERAAREVSIRLEEEHSSVVIRHGIVFSKPDNEQCFIIDSDFFVESRTETANALECLARFNQHARNLFRWCIDDQLHEKLVPKPLPKSP